MVQESEMTYDEKVACYAKIPKRKLIDMLIECNRILDIKKSASYNFHEPTRKEKIATHILTGILTNPDRYNTKSIVEDALAITDELIKQLDE